MMKKLFLVIACIIVSVTMTAQERAVMPTIIVFPADTWMHDHHYMKDVNVGGQLKSIPQYERMFVENREMGSALTAVQKVFEERKFDHKDLQSVLKDYANERAEDMANKADGNGTDADIIDELLQQAHPDIRMDLDYSAEKFGPMKNVTFNLKAVDAYSLQQVGAIQGTIEATGEPVDLVLRKFIAANSADLSQQIIDYYKDLRANGRRINVVFKVASGAGIDFLKNEIGEDGDTYADFLTDWVRKHAVNKAAKKGRQTNKTVTVTDVRIPFFDEDGTPIEADDWAKKVRKAFREETGIKITKASGGSLGRAVFSVGGRSF